MTVQDVEAADRGGNAQSRPSPPSRGRRLALLFAAVILAGAVAVLSALFAVSTASDGATSVLIGALSSDRLTGLALVTGLGALAAGICLIPVPRRWLILLIPARIAAIGATCLAGLALSFTSSATVVPLLAGGCETGYVVVEDSFLLAGWGTVYRTDGILVTAVERTGGDDGYRPFADGAYAVVDDGGSLAVWYSFGFDPSAAPVATDREPDFTLPRRTDRALSCGLSAGARTPLPPEPTVPRYDTDEARAGVAHMVAVSLAAAVGGVRDSAGEPVDPDALAQTATACDEGGTRVGLAVEFSTDDNAASLTRILQVWDAAGYSPDRAMQEDIRYSDVLPVEKMSIRDTTTIDGLIHLQVVSRCTTR